MESFKTAVGLGGATTTTANNETHGQEPLNGVMGAGTVDQPYDAGNADVSYRTDASASADHTSTDGKDLAAPLKPLTSEDTVPAPASGILASLASAVGLGSTTTAAGELSGQEPVSGMAGKGTADQPYDAGNEDDAALGGQAAQHTRVANDVGVKELKRTSAIAPISNGTSEHDPAASNQGLQFVGGGTAMNTNSSRATGQQSHASITHAVEAGALGGTEDPAHSNKGLAFVSTADGKHPTESLVPKTSNHQPVTGTSGTYVIGQPLGFTQQSSAQPYTAVSSAGTTASKATATTTTTTTTATHTESSSAPETSPPSASNPAAPGSDTTYTPEPVDGDGLQSANTGPALISSLFSNPFAKRDSISGVSGEADLDPVSKGVAGSEPIPELRDHAVPVKAIKETRPLPPQSSGLQPRSAPGKPESIVVEPRQDGMSRPANHLGSDVPPGAASPKREKGKGKVYGDTDSNSTRSSLTRHESASTSQTGPSTLDSRRISSHTPGRIPTAGGIVLGEKAGKERERRASFAPSGHSAVTSDPRSARRESLQKVAEDTERTAVSAPRAPVNPAQTPAKMAPSPVTPQKASTDEMRTSTPGRVPGTEMGSLASPSPIVANASRFSEHGMRDTPSPSEATASPATRQRKTSLVSRIGQKLSIKSSSKSPKLSSSTAAHPESIPEKK